MGDEPQPAALGPNAWLVDEMYEQYLADPASVSEAWRDFFADYRREADRPAPTPAAERRPARPGPQAAVPAGAPAAPVSRAAPVAERPAPAAAPGRP
ncbi:MAG: 2-oxoglutarate dehydrogenase E1 subunit family protein, partial [Acidimicrobiia bacterium]